MIRKAAISATGTKTWLCYAVRTTPAFAMVLAMALGHDAGTSTAATPALPAPPANGEMAFVVTSFHTPVYVGDLKQDCPDGLMRVLRDDYLATLPRAERDRLNLKENETERETAWKNYGRNDLGGNLCANVYEFMDRPPTPMMKGSTGWGFNLDGDESGGGKDNYTCKHANMTSPTGEKGVDHQAWRVVGCSVLYIGVDSSGKGGERIGAYDRMMMSGEWTQVMILKGVNSLVNDPDVQVIYANTDDRPITDAAGQPIHNASYTVASAGRKLQYRNVLHGRIVNGVLTTDMKDILLGQNGGPGGANGRFDLEHGRVRIEFQPDGTVKGMVGGYQPLLSLIAAARGGGAGSVNTAGINCAGEYTALRMMADGDKDPKTGQCRRISYAYEYTAVPAFVSDVEPAKTVAVK